VKIYIGTSGWHYKHWLGNFYPEKLPFSKMLDYYCKHFSTVEINNSFYMLPQVSTLEAWRDGTPKNFKFAIKASRFLTHNKKLKEPENALNNFLPRAEALGNKLGPILFQLPPKWKVNRERLEEFLEHAILNYGIPPGIPDWNPAYPDDPSRREYAARILARHPETAHGSIHAAAISGDIAEVERLLKQDRRSASLKGGLGLAAT